MPDRIASPDYLDDDLVDAAFDDEAEDLDQIEQLAEGEDALVLIDNEEPKMETQAEAEERRLRKTREHDNAKPIDTDDKSAEDRQEDLLDEGIEESFPASDPVSVKRIT